MTRRIVDILNDIFHGIRIKKISKEQEFKQLKQQDGDIVTLDDKEDKHD